MMIETKRLHAGLTKDAYKVKTIVTIRMLWSGVLIGFVVSVAAGITQFIVRFGYFSLLQEIGVVSLGFIGAVFGALCGIIKWRYRSALAVNEFAVEMYNRTGTWCGCR